MPSGSLDSQVRVQQTESCVNGRSQWVQLNKSTFPSLRCRWVARRHCPPLTDMQQESLLQKDRPDYLVPCVPVLFSSTCPCCLPRCHHCLCSIHLVSPRRRITHLSTLQQAEAWVPTETVVLGCQL